MAHPRTDLPILEQPRRPALWLSLSAIALLLTGVLLFALRPGREHVEGHAYSIPSPNDRILVEVLNGTTRQGLARVATRALRQRGLDVVYFGNADSASETTRILVRRGDPGQGRDVRDALGVGTVTVAPDTLRRVDVSVILGEDFRIRGGLHP
jgi:hypothetical protein